MDDLVMRLSQDKHPVEVSLRPQRTAAALKARIDQYAFVHIKFTDTKGGTVLGFKLIPEESDWTSGDFDLGKGIIRLCGLLKLNYVPVKCIADINLNTLDGTGHLEILPENTASQSEPPYEPN